MKIEMTNYERYLIFLPVHLRVQRQQRRPIVWSVLAMFVKWVQRAKDS